MRLLGSYPAKCCTTVLYIKNKSWKQKRPKRGGEWRNVVLLLISKSSNPNNYSVKVFIFQKSQGSSNFFFICTGLLPSLPRTCTKKKSQICTSIFCFLLYLKEKVGFELGKQRYRCMYYLLCIYCR